jgi:hypothetical protein
MTAVATQTDAAPEKFCPQCGASRLPLGVMHLSKDCGDCGRTIYFVRRGECGTGIKVEAGERFHIPEGYIQTSLEPKPNGKLFRQGLPFLLNTLFLAGKPAGNNAESFFRQLEKEWDQVLMTTAEGKGLDLSNAADTEELSRRFEGKWQSHMGYTLAASILAGDLARSEMTPEARESAWAGYMVGTLRGLTIVSEPLFEETLWRGYLANEVVFEAAAAAGNRSPAEIEAMKLLRPLFAQFDEATLSALVDSGVPIGPKINVARVPEEVLRSMARHQLVTVQRERQEAKEAIALERDDERHRRAERRHDNELRIKWGTLGALVAGGVISAATFGIDWYRTAAESRTSAPPGQGTAAQPGPALGGEAADRRTIPPTATSSAASVSLPAK